MRRVYSVKAENVAVGVERRGEGGGASAAVHGGRWRGRKLGGRGRKNRKAGGGGDAGRAEALLLLQRPELEGRRSAPC